jgi:hypothetical protein
MKACPCQGFDFFVSHPTVLEQDQIRPSTVPFKLNLGATAKWCELSSENL